MTLIYLTILVKITKDLQMEWSQELAKVSKTKIYESGMFLSVLYPHILLPKINFGNILHIALSMLPKMYFGHILYFLTFHLP